MEKKSLIFDGHLDLAMNAMEWNRDLRWTVEEIRQSEEGMTDKPDRAKGTVSFPSLREGHVGICVATQIGRYVKRGNPSARMEVTGTGMGTNPGTAGMV